MLINNIKKTSKIGFVEEKKTLKRGIF